MSSAFFEMLPRQISQVPVEAQLRESDMFRLKPCRARGIRADEGPDRVTLTVLSHGKALKKQLGATSRGAGHNVRDTR
ncbi:hypothetical protein DOFOFD_09170 [Acetobacteraceae bacterium EV16P]|uniref:Uncharacterized protein n=1 Tax=Sorlinia euscelidii TaxID=3081148 RepID=A0ABU7U3V1_9PROT